MAIVQAIISANAITQGNAVVWVSKQGDNQSHTRDDDITPNSFAKLNTLYNDRMDNKSFYVT